MMGIYHLLWIVPLSAGLGALIMAVFVGSR
jgi:hypothetical protein